MAEVFYKDESDVLDYKFDYSDFLGSSDTIATSTFTIPSDLTSVSETEDDTSATIFLSGGTDDTRYIIQNKITTTEGRTAERAFILIVKETDDITPLIMVVRTLIDDFGDSPTYNDDRIRRALVTGGLIASQEVSLANTYTFDLKGVEITPSPVNKSDDEAIALFTLKAACILDTNKLQDGVSNSIRVRDGDTEIDTSRSFQGYRDILILGPCATYQKLIKEAKIKNSMGIGKAIMSPITHEDYTGSRVAGCNGTGLFLSVQRYFDSMKTI